MVNVTLLTTVTGKGSNGGEFGVIQLIHPWKNEDKITCIKTDTCYNFTINKIYEINIDVRYHTESIRNDNNISVPLSCCFENFTTKIKNIKRNINYSELEQLKKNRKLKLQKLKWK